MFLALAIILAALIPELFLKLIPINFTPILKKKSRTVFVSIYRRNGTKEKNRKIVIRKGADNNYRITDNVWLNVENKYINIFYPYKERLYPKKYTLNDGTKLVFKRRKLQFVLTFFAIVLVNIPIGGVKLYLNRKIVPEFINTSYHFALTHDYIEYIDYEKYKGITNYLIVGTNGREDKEEHLADVIAVVSFNENTKKINITSLLRDVLVLAEDKNRVTKNEIPKSSPYYEELVKNADIHKYLNMKLNETLTLKYYDDDPDKHTEQQSYTAGLNSLVNAIEYNFRIPITGVVSVSWSEFLTIMDKFGTVDIENFMLSFMKQKNFKLFTILTPGTVADISKDIYSSLTADEISELVDLSFKGYTPVNNGSIPYDFHPERYDDKNVLIVDPRVEEPLAEQAINKLSK